LDPRTGEEISSVNVPTLHAIAYSPDGRSIAVGVGESLVNPRRDRVIPLADSAAIPAVRTFECPASYLLFAPDGRTILGCRHGDLICLWETVTGKERSRIPGRFTGLTLSPDRQLCAAADRSENIIRIWELASLKEIQRLDGHEADITCLAFSPDGKTLASGGGDFAVHLWDVTMFRKNSATSSLALTETELQNRWTFLAGDDAERAYHAIVSLGQSPREALPFLRDRLQGSEAEFKRIARLIADLDANDYETREAATLALTRLGNSAEAALKGALERNPPLEVVRRIESLLERLEKGVLSAEQVRQVRAVEALERMGTAEAKALLEQFSRQTPSTILTQESRAAVRRLTGK
jgi:hypothetical protein